MMRRLYLQIAAAIVAIVLLAFCAFGGVVFHHERPARWTPPWAAAVAELVAEQVGGEAQRDLDALHLRLGVDLAVWSGDGAPLAASGARLPAPDLAGDSPQPVRGDYRGHAVAARVADGRWFVAGTPWPHKPSMGFMLGSLGTFFGVLILGSFPLARRITRRLEHLQSGVEAWGQGELSRRVPVEGRDEVARLAESFNASAARVEALVEGQRRMLASASHELRSPLARVRMAMELLEGDPAVRAGAERDVAELDELIGDLLLASRIETLGRIAGAPVALGPIVAEEAARVGGVASGDGEVVGDAKMLRRMVRNLLENAKRHGGGEISARIEPGRLVVEDRGPGVAESERERIFEPFYRPAGHREGTDGGVGLGLALVRQIARLHGGDVRHEPREGGGSRFVVELPAAASPTRRP